MRFEFLTSPILYSSGRADLSNTVRFIFQNVCNIKLDHPMNQFYCAMTIAFGHRNKFRIGYIVSSAH